MKNFEKHIDEIAKFIYYKSDCDTCPCEEECRNNDGFEYCSDFFKDWAMKEAEE